MILNCARSSGAIFFVCMLKAWFRNLVTVQARPKRFPQLSQA